MPPRPREIALGTIRAAQEHRRRRLEQERVERAREEARLAQEREGERRREEQRRVDALIEMSERWRQAEAARGFVRACRSAAESSDSESGSEATSASTHEQSRDPSGEDLKWLRSAEAVADGLDPLARGFGHVVAKTRAAGESKPPRLGWGHHGGEQHGWWQGT